MIESSAQLQLLENLISASNEGFFAFDEKCRYTYWSNSMAKITGLSAAAVIGRLAFEVFPYLRETHEDNFFRKALGGERTTSSRRKFHIPETGKSGYHDTRYSPFVVNGRIVGGIAVVSDTTERILTDEVMKEMESRFKNMADHSPVLLWMSRTDGLCTFFNQTWLDFTGRSLNEEWGVGWAEGIHAEDFQFCMDTYIEAFNARRPFEMEYRLRRADGAYRWILDRGAPRYSPEGLFVGFIGSCVDISERKELELSLRKAVRARDEFLSIASHELKTPLSSLTLQLGMLGSMAETKIDTSIALDRLQKINTNARKQMSRLTKLIEDLLSVSRISSGQLKLERGPVELTTVVEDAIDRIGEMSHAAGCTLEKASMGPIHGLWDGAGIDQIVTNLLTNAIKYAPGKPIHVEVLKEGEQARIRVRDEGPGIPETQRATIFEKFQRGNSPKGAGGLGLGLYISRMIADGHGGRIWVESEVGRGSTFTVELPIQNV